MYNSIILLNDTFEKFDIERWFLIYLIEHTVEISFKCDLISNLWLIIFFDNKLKKFANDTIKKNQYTYLRNFFNSVLRIPINIFL